MVNNFLKKAALLKFKVARYLPDNLFASRESVLYISWPETDGEVSSGTRKNSPRPPAEAPTEGPQYASVNHFTKHRNGD